jgi:hypothetical protein
MWMKNGERCYARWFPKDHASRGKPVAQHHSRRFCRQLRRHTPKKRPAEAGRFPYSIAIFVILTTSTIPIAATIPVWLNNDDLIPTTSKISIPTPIPITTVTVVNTDTCTTGANAELNALSGRRSGTKQGGGSNNN